MSDQTVEAFAAIFGLPVVSACIWNVKIEGLKTISEKNTREHYMRKAARVNEQKRRVWMALQTPSFKAFQVKPPRLVKLIRYAPRKLDSDNLARALSAVRDQIAASLGINDGRDDITAWTYGQERGDVGVRIEFWR